MADVLFAIHYLYHTLPSTYNLNSSSRTNVKSVADILSTRTIPFKYLFSLCPHPFSFFVFKMHVLFYDDTLLINS